LGKVLELQRGYDLPSSQMEKGDILVAGSNGVIGYHNEARSNHPCITVGRSGSVGKVHYYEQATWAHNTALFVKDFKGNDPKYLYYFLKNLHLDKMFDKGSSVVPSLDRKVVHSLNVPCHKDIDCQKRIAAILSKIDRKIELNRAINQNLEAMAKQLYDYWFVQFDFPNEEGKPYKSSGDKMVWNEKLKREIPEGWDISLIKDIATTYSGGTPKSTNIEYYDNGEIAWINSGELNSPIITKTTNYITKCGLENSSAKLYPSNSILVAMYGATAGKVSLLTFEACSNQAVCGVIPTIENMLYYVYFHISSLYSHFITLSTGSARDNISQDTIKNILLPIPTRNILKLFDEKIGSIYQTIVNNYQQIDSLTKQRDELLPLLMNGQVSVNSDLSAH
jgi:type I restriction enzyme S subunit